MLLLVGFDTLTYRKDYDWPPYTCGSSTFHSCDHALCIKFFHVQTSPIYVSDLPLQLQCLVLKNMPPPNQPPIDSCFTKDHMQNYPNAPLCLSVLFHVSPPLLLVFFCPSIMPFEFFPNGSPKRATSTTGTDIVITRVSFFANLICYTMRICLLVYSFLCAPVLAHSLFFGVRLCADDVNHRSQACPDANTPVLVSWKPV